MNKSLDFYISGEKTIAVVGRFSRLCERPMITLSNDGKGDGPLRGVDLFALLRPHLGYVADSVIRCGEHMFNTYRLSTPLRGEGQPMPLSLDALLTEEEDVPGGPGAYQRHQRKGARIFKRLVADLNTLIGFDHPNFDRSLLAVVREYVPMAVTSAGTDPLFDERWKTCLSTEKALADACLGRLTCPPEDAGAASARIGRVLNDLVAKGRIALFPAQAGAVRKVMDDLESQLHRGVIGREADPFLELLSRDGNLPFLRDWCADAGHAVPGAAGLGASGPGFAAFYRRWRLASDRVHRVAMSTHEHPYLVAFLASKYREHDFVGMGDAAREMARRGVLAHHDRLPGVTLEQSRRDQELLRKAVPDPSFTAQLQGDRNYQTFQGPVESAIAGLLRVTTAFTRSALLDSMESTYSAMGQVCGGEAGRLVRGVAEFAEAHRKFLARLATLQAAPGSVLQASAFREALVGLCVSDEERKFVNSFMNRVPADARDVRRAVREAFVSALAAEGKTRFASGYLGSLQKINSEDLRHRTRYNAHLRLSVGSKGEEPGVTGVAVTGRVMVRENEEPRAARDRARSFREAAGLTDDQPMPSSVQSTLPADLEDKVADDATLEVKIGGDVIGALSRKGLILTVTPARPELAPLLCSEKACVILAGAPRVLSDLGLRGLEAFSHAAAAPEHDIVDSLDALNDVREELHARLHATPKSDEEDAVMALRRAALALRFSEYLLSAPASLVSLDAPDISKGVGIVLEMLAHVADPRDGEALYENRPSRYAGVGLDRVKLWKFFPIAEDDPDQMAVVLQYFYTCCNELEKVREYRDELRVLAETVDALATEDVRVLVVNETLQQHTAVPAAAMFAPSRYAPGIVYLTRQAFDDPSKAPAEFHAFARRVAGLLPKTDVAVPVVVSDVPVGSASAALPVLDRDSFALPRFRPGRPGLNHNGDWTSAVVTRLIQAEPYLLLAASLLAPRASFGSLALPTEAMPRPDDEGAVYADMADDLRFTRFRETLNVQPEPGEPLSALLHRAWFEYPNTRWSNPLFELLVSSRLATLSGWVRRQDPTKSLLKNYTDVLARLIEQSEDVKEAAVEAGSHPALARAVTSVAVQASGSWTPPKANGHPVPIGHPLAVQRGEGGFNPVVLDRAEWFARFAPLLPPDA